MNLNSPKVPIENRLGIFGILTLSGLILFGLAVDHKNRESKADMLAKEARTTFAAKCRPDDPVALPEEHQHCLQTTIELLHGIWSLSSYRTDAITWLVHLTAAADLSDRATFDTSMYALRPALLAIRRADIATVENFLITAVAALHAQTKNVSKSSLKRLVARELIFLDAADERKKHEPQFRTSTLGFAHYVRGRLALSENDLSGAQQHFRLALEAAPLRRLYSLWLARTYILLNQRDEAQATAQKALLTEDSLEPRSRIGIYAKLLADELAGASR